MVQRLRICLPIPGTQVPSLGQEDPTCWGTTKPMGHNFTDAPLLDGSCSTTREAAAVRSLQTAPKRKPALAADRESPWAAKKTQHSLANPQKELVWSPLGKGPRTGWFWGVKAGRTSLLMAWPIPCFPLFAQRLLSKLFWTEFKARHSCLPPEEQSAVLAVHEKFSGLLWVSSAGLGQDQGALSGQEPRALCPSSKGSTFQACRRFHFY